jgi:hypothetical protein
MWKLDEYRKRPQRLADHLPWAALIGPGVVLNKDGSFQKTIAFRGPDLDSSTPYELVAGRARMNNVLRRLGSQWCVHVEACRRSAATYSACEFPNPVAAMIDQERREAFAAEALHFESECYFTFTYLPPAERMTRLSDFFIERPGKGFRTPVSYRAYYDHFLGQVEQVVNLMASFMPTVRPLDDAGTLTYLHGCISDRRLSVAVRDLPSDYSFDVRQAAQGIGYAAPTTKPTGPTAQELALAEQLRQLADLRGRMLEEERKEQEQALDSPLVFAGAKSFAPAASASVETSSTTRPTMAVLSRPDGSVGGVTSAQTNGITLGLGQSDQQDKQAFLTQAAAVEPQLNKPLLTPVSKYELKAGSVIAGALVTAIDTGTSIPRLEK